jgi:hypothetical protein
MKVSPSVLYATIAADSRLRGTNKWGKREEMARVVWLSLRWIEANADSLSAEYATLLT